MREMVIAKAPIDELVFEVISKKWGASWRSSNISL